MSRAIELAAGGYYAKVANASAATLFSVGSTFSLVSLAAGLAFAAAFVVLARSRRGRPLTWRYLWTALRPRAGVFGASGRTDAGFFLLNTFSAGGLIGWGLISQAAVAASGRTWLAAALGPSHAHAGGAWAAAATSLGLYLAYELAYWVDHWLSHNVPALWEIHKVHHTAEALSPLTNFRVHPLETLKFYNIAALFTGLAAAGFDYGLGVTHGRLVLWGADAVFVATMFTTGHLLHTHVWLAFPRRLGRMLMSPAAHQIHHSTDPRHFGCNLGNTLAVFDWAFGTLRLPGPAREPLSFGVAGEGPEAHTIAGSLIAPMLNAVRALRTPLGAPAPVVSTDRALS